jgi:hypothetical protein
MCTVYALDEDRRIARWYSCWEHALEALAFMVKEGDDEEAAFLRREMDLLEPYWNQPDVTKEQAVAAFHARNLFRQVFIGVMDSEHEPAAWEGFLRDNADSGELSRESWMKRMAAWLHQHCVQPGAPVGVEDVLRLIRMKENRILAVQKTLVDCDEAIADLERFRELEPEAAAEFSPDNYMIFFTRRQWAIKALAALERGEALPPLLAKE